MVECGGKIGNEQGVSEDGDLFAMTFAFAPGCKSSKLEFSDNGMPPSFLYEQSF